MKRVMIILMIMFSVLFIAGCISDIEWRKVQEEGIWKAVNQTCVNKNPLKYMCEENCYEKSNAMIWDFCRNLGIERKTNTNIDVLCFENGCVPQLVTEGCRLMCPTS